MYWDCASCEGNTIEGAEEGGDGWSESCSI